MASVPIANVKAVKSSGGAKSAKTPNMKWVKPPIFLLCLVPLANLVWKGFHDGLGANPAQLIEHSTGTWALVGLCVTLAVTPLRKITHLNWLIRFRRMFGLYAFFYGCLHLTTYLVFDQSLEFGNIIPDVYKRPFITVGFTAWLLMLPLAITSTSWMIRRLGGKRWQLLHRLIYASAIAGVIHYDWLVKSDKTVPYEFAVAVTILLGYRLVTYTLDRRRETARVGAKQPAVSD